MNNEITKELNNQEENNKTHKSLDAENLRKWIRIIPHSVHSFLIDECLLNGLQSFFCESNSTTEAHHIQEELPRLTAQQIHEVRRFMSQQQQNSLNNVCRYLITKLKGFSDHEIELSQRETLVVVSLINDLASVVESIEEETHSDMEKMSQSFWTLLLETRKDRNVDIINQRHYKTDLITTDSQGNPIVDGNELCSLLIQGVNPFKFSTDLVLLRSQYQILEGVLVKTEDQKSHQRWNFS